MTVFHVISVSSGKDSDETLRQALARYPRERVRAVICDTGNEHALVWQHIAYIENRPAISVMQAHDGPDTLHFVDPPYLPETRRPGRYYTHEMTEAQHLELLQAVSDLDGMVVLCGYPSALYATRLAGWQQHTTMARISSNRGTTLRQEIVWINPACMAALEIAQGELFSAGIDVVDHLDEVSL